MEDFKIYCGLGWGHIINAGALDHILFIIALTAIYTIKEWKKVLILVTAFTIGHSITLALSTFNMVHLQAKWVEFAIVLTIIITAINNFFWRSNEDSINRNYILALCFGLIHGLGFASGLRSLLGKNESILIPLLGFNTGLEIGQIVIVLLILFISIIPLVLFRVPRKGWVIFLSAGVFSLALKLAIERWP